MTGGPGPKPGATSSGLALTMLYSGADLGIYGGR